jgi:DNA-binding NtrC family response regulator
LESLIQCAGYKTAISVKNLEQLSHAIDASDPKPSTILLDYALPQADIIKLVQSLHKQNFKVILMSNTLTAANLAQSLKIPFLFKPFSIKELQQVLTT